MKCIEIYDTFEYYIYTYISVAQHENDYHIICVMIIPVIMTIMVTMTTHYGHYDMYKRQ